MHLNTFILTKGTDEDDDHCKLIHSLEYLVKSGIKRKRLRSRGFGESVPLIQCDTTRVCTEQEHSINRRCEFIILK